MKYIITLALFIFSLGSHYGQSCHESGNEVHAMAPIGIMGGHTHAKGHFMAGYSYMNMAMLGMSRQGSTVTNEHVLNTYMMSSEQMMMQMHMIDLMYAPTDRLTLSVMTDYQVNTMEMVSTPGHSSEVHGHDHQTGSVSTEAPATLEHSDMSGSGFGDTKLTALLRLNKNMNRCIHLIGGVTLPTGSVTLHDRDGVTLPYGMQTGYGTAGVFGGVNLSWLTPHYLIGLQSTASGPLFINQSGYLPSNSYRASVWASRKWTSWLSSSVRAYAQYFTAVRGADATLDPVMSPFNDGRNEERYNMQALLGLNIKPFDKWRFGVEGGIPVYQWNKGIHMDQSYSLTAGAQFFIH